MTASVLRLHDRLSRWPAGRWLFSHAVCLKAPYFASIAPRIEHLEANRCEATLRHRRRVTNHLGTVHAIALCNLAELTAGLMTEASLKKAVGTMRAVATPAQPIIESAQGYDLLVDVAIVDPADDAVFRARITMWVSPRRG